MRSHDAAWREGCDIVKVAEDQTYVQIDATERWELVMIAFVA